MAIRDAYELGELEDGTALRALVEELFSCRIERYEKVGEGFYAQVYEITIGKAPHRFIIKCHKHSDRAHAEAQQLDLLRQHALVRVPEVYAEKARSAVFPCDALVMEHIPGINAAKVEFPDERTRRAFADEVVENLSAWHGVHHADGFGDIGAPLAKTWRESYGAKVISWHEHLGDRERNAEVSAFVRRIVDKSCELFAEIFAATSAQSSLVHSDYNAWNMMVDPATYRLSGVIDPIDAGWADPEIDLFHLPNGRPDLGLLECYLEKREVDDAFWMRYYFYRFWDDIKHYLRMGWYEEQRFAAYAKQLDEQLCRCITTP